MVTQTPFKMPEIPDVERVKTPREFTLNWLRDMGYRGDELTEGNQLKNQAGVGGVGLCGDKGPPSD